ncbi:hypothetical protein RHSIM_Rhsim03G0087500 [Rhododendron simsii]|uniref:RNase H type-1 domain-containing protein n=1 Tax=Rhododendron simsii TaxID=118357 RepID=A0A834HJ89_RHOSS|nr:hypothetical protein RHSIM_Rhsim03G0087500 [Rhododendron simsii]
MSPPMATQIHHHHHLHFLIVPLMSQSHLIPMTDFAKLLAAHHCGLTVTIITTPLNAACFQPLINRATSSGFDIRLIPLRFPCSEAGLPESIENLDSLTSPDHVTLFFTATSLLQRPLEKLISELKPPPSCLITSNALPWTSEIAAKFDIPIYVFNAISCFTLLCSNRIEDRIINTDSDSILVPDMPHRIEFKKTQLPEIVRKNASKLKGILDHMRGARGLLVNSFEDMEMKYVEGYKKIAENTWCIGPVSLCNKEVSDKFDRGNKAAIDEHYCLKWLDSKSSNSVIYACFGSLCHISCSQLIEIGLGLESLNQPFIWIIRGADKSAELEMWLETEEFEERNKERGELGEMAKKAVEEGGSSYLNMALLIEDVIQHANQSNGVTKTNALEPSLGSGTMGLIFRGLTIILGKGIIDVKLETDWFTAVRLLNGDIDIQHQHAALVEDSKMLMSRTGTTTTHVCRMSNQRVLITLLAWELINKTRSW